MSQRAARALGAPGGGGDALAAALDRHRASPCWRCSRRPSSTCRRRTRTAPRSSGRWGSAPTRASTPPASSARSWRCSPRCCCRSSASTWWRARCGATSSAGCGRSSPPPAPRRRATCWASGWRASPTCWCSRRWRCCRRSSSSCATAAGRSRSASCCCRGCCWRRRRWRSPPPSRCSSTSRPGSRGRGGYVLWFFAFSFLFMMIPAHAQRAPRRRPAATTAATSYDPAGLVFFHDLIARSVSEPSPLVSLGIIFTDEPVERVPFAPLRVDGRALAERGTTLGVDAGAAARGGRHVPLDEAARGAAAAAAAVGAGRSSRRRRQWVRRAPRPRSPPRCRRSAPHQGSPRVRAARCSPKRCWSGSRRRGSSGRCSPPRRRRWWCRARARRRRWPSSCCCSAPVIGEAAARESLDGTGATVFAQPGVPRSAVRLEARRARSPSSPWRARRCCCARSAAARVHGLAMLLGLAFTATAAAGLGWLTGGGKLFLGAYTALWYMAIQRDSPLDFTGAFGQAPRPRRVRELCRRRRCVRRHRGGGGEGAHRTRMSPWRRSTRGRL